MSGIRSTDDRIRKLQMDRERTGVKEDEEGMFK